MTEQRAALFAFTAVLVAICYLCTVAAYLASVKAYTEALGIGTAVVGLIGVLGTFRPRQAQGTTVANVETANVTNGEPTP